MRSHALKKKKKVGRIILLGISLFVAVGGLIFLLYLQALSLTSISVQGNSIVEETEIVEYTDSILDGKYMHFFPKSSILLYPRQAVEAGLLKQFPRLREARVELGEWNTLAIDVQERDTDTIWCRDLPDTTSEECYFSDDAGYVFAEAPHFSNSVFIKVYSQLASEPIGSTVISRLAYETAVHFAKFLPKIFVQSGFDRFRLVAVRIIDEKSFEAVVADTSISGLNEWKIYYDNEEPVSELTLNLFTIMNSPDFKSDLEKNKTGLESIDLRYGKKVFYKFR